MEFIKDSLNTENISDYSRGLADSAKVDINIFGFLGLVITVAIICIAIYVIIAFFKSVKPKKKDDKRENNR